jgi:hypothetical protein
MANSIKIKSGIVINSFEVITFACPVVMNYSGPTN